MNSMKSVDMSALRDACAQFYEVLHLATVSQSNGDRVVDTPVLAQVLSRATNDLSRAMARAINELFRAYALVQSCNSDGSISWHPASEDPWEALPSSGLKIMTLDLGPSGTPPLLWTALNYAIKVVAFPPDLQHRMVGGDGMSTRWRDGDVICRQDIERIDHVAGLIGLAEKAATVPLTPFSPPETRPNDPFRFQKIGMGWLVRYRHENGLFPDSLGLKHIWTLLHHPFKQEPLSPEDLLGLAALPPEGTPDELLDARQLQELRQDAVRLKEELEDAQFYEDTGRINQALKALEHIHSQIQSGQGLKGKFKHFTKGSERRSAANAVDQAILRAITKLRRQDPPLSALADFLKASIRRQGNSFRYQPVGQAPDWVLDGQVNVGR